MLQPGTMKILQTTLILQSDGGLSNMKFTSLHLTTIRVNTNVLFAFDNVEICMILLSLSNILP